MSTLKDGGTAFPCEGGNDSGLLPDPGMSLRDYFAAMALNGITSGKLFIAISSVAAGGLTESQKIAKAAYELADAMLAEREKGGV
jgi:hypothetical protein